DKGAGAREAPRGTDAGSMTRTRCSWNGLRLREGRGRHRVEATRRVEAEVGLVGLHEQPGPASLQYLQPRVLAFAERRPWTQVEHDQVRVVARDEWRRAIRGRPVDGEGHLAEGQGVVPPLRPLGRRTTREIANVN